MVVTTHMATEHLECSQHNLINILLLNWNLNGYMWSLAKVLESIVLDAMQTLL
jgi:hypothetical protein